MPTLRMPLVITRHRYLTNAVLVDVNTIVHQALTDLQVQDATNIKNTPIRQEFSFKN